MIRYPLIVIGLVLIVGAVSGYTETIDFVPALYIIDLSASHDVNNMTMESDASFTNGSWTLSGTDDQLTFTLLDARQSITFSAGTMQQFNFTGGAYRYFYLHLQEGFPSGSSLEVHLNYSTPLQEPDSQSLSPMNFTVKRTPFVSVFSLGSSVGIVQNYTLKTNITSTGTEWYMFGTNTSPKMGDAGATVTLVDDHSSTNLIGGTEYFYDISSSAHFKYYVLYIKSGFFVPSWLEVRFNSGGGAAPGASFTVNATEGHLPFAVQFTDTSTGSPTSWNWSFGDGNVSSDQNPSHAFPAGTFTINLTVCNGGGCDIILMTDYITSIAGECSEPAGEKGVVPIELMYILTPLAMGLSVYGVSNYTNRVYGNIIIGGASAAVIWYFLAANTITGNFFYSRTDKYCVCSDTPLFWVFVLLGVVMTVYTFVLSLEAIREKNIGELVD